MQKNTVVKLTAVFSALLVMLIIVMSVPQLRWSFLSVVSSKPVCRECGHLHVIHDYYEATGISRESLGCSPEEIVEMYGSPIRIDEEIRPDGRLRMIYIYGGFGIEFSSKDPEQPEEVIGFRLYSPDLEIRHDIHVGSTREQIIHAYRKCPTTTERYAEVNNEELGDSILDTGYRNAWENALHFTYDENDIVTSITYYPAYRYN